MQALLPSVPPALQQATADSHLCWRHQEAHGQVWVSLLWGHCSFLLGLGAHKVLFVPSKSLFPFLFKFWQLYGGVNGDLLQESLCHTQVYCTQSPCPCSSPVLTCTSTGECWIPPKKDTPHPRAKEKPQQDGRRDEIVFRIKAHSHQTLSGAQTNFVCTKTQRPHRD